LLLILSSDLVHETHFESKIKDSVETTDSPFDNEFSFLNTDNRATQRRKGKKRKSGFSYNQRTWRSRNSCRSGQM